MKKYPLALSSALLIGSLMMFSPLTHADEEQAYREQEKSYGEKVGEKALSGFTNINTAILEIPKNIINATNQSDSVALGFVGGTAKGILNTVGRLFSGITDLVTAPIPTQPIAQPNYIWQDFDVDTTYGKVFRLDGEPDSTTGMGY